MLIRLFTSKCAFYVGDSTAKVVNSEQIPPIYSCRYKNRAREKICHIFQKWRNGLEVNMIRAGR